MAIVQPSEMDFSNKHFSMIIAGTPGIGKTTLALSAPNPILIDFDKGVSRVKASHRKTTILCDTYNEVLADIDSDTFKAAETVIIDTGGSFITYLQAWAMRENPTLNCQKNGAISQKGFGAVKSEFLRFTNSLQYTMNKNIVYIFHTVEEKDGDVVKHRLMCEGAARNLVWQPCDLGCFVQIVNGKRYLGFTPTEQYFAKGCFGISGLHEVPDLDDGRPNTMLTQLFENARKNIAAETARTEKERPVYDAAMEHGRKIVSDVIDPASAVAAVEGIKSMEHALTSEKEIRAMLSAKLKEIGLKWDKQAGQYVQA